MRKASVVVKERQPTRVEGTDVMRATVVVSRDLVAEFREIAKRNERTFSQELRRLMSEYVARDQQERMAA